MMGERYKMPPQLMDGNHYAPAEERVIVPLKSRETVLGGQVRGCSVLLLVLAGLSLLFSLFVVMIQGGEAARMYLLSVSGPLLLVSLVLFFGQRLHEKRRLARSEEHVIVTSSEITVPTISGKERVRWIDLREVRMTRDTGGKVYYEFYSDAEAPEIVVEWSRILRPAQLEREIEAHAGPVVRAFEPRKAAPVPPSANRTDVPQGERFNIRLPQRVSHSAAGCAGVLVALALLFAAAISVALAFPRFAERWMDSPLVMFAFVGLPAAGFFAGFFLIRRGQDGWIVCAADGLHSRLPVARFPSFIAWSEIRDFTLVTERGMDSGTVTPSRSGSDRYELTIWTAAGSYSLECAAISDKTELLEILRTRSARKGGAFMEQVHRDLDLLLRK